MEFKNINPWLNIWVRPKATIRFILDTNPKCVIIWLAIIGGMISSLAWLGYTWISYPSEQNIQHILYFILILVGGALLGLFYLYVGGWLYQLTGSWIGGKGTFIDLKCAVGWSHYPLIVSNMISFLSLLAIPNLWTQTIFGMVDIVTMIWGFLVFLNLVAEAHRFSAWKALLTFVIALILLFVAIMIISLFVPLLAPLFY